MLYIIYMNTKIVPLDCAIVMRNKVRCLTSLPLIMENRRPLDPPNNSSQQYL
jgi:hypothetical protein